MKFAKMALCMAAVLTLAGCGQKEAQPAQATMVMREATEATSKITPESPDPQGALEAVYQLDSAKHAATESVSQIRLSEIIANPGFTAEELYARYSDAKEGLADVIIAKPEEGEMGTMVGWLYKYQERRIAEFENFDILDSHSIARDAIIYEQGGYAILLMLPDNDAAQAVIDEYIPQ